MVTIEQLAKLAAQAAISRQVRSPAFQQTPGGLQTYQHGPIGPASNNVPPHIAGRKLIPGGLATTKTDIPASTAKSTTG